IAPFGDAYEKIGTIQRRLAWPLHKDDTLFQSGRPTGLNIYLIFSSPTVRQQCLSVVWLCKLLARWYALPHYHMCVYYVRAHP
ncbi:hypothetical protein BC826DRAFT_906360, partial [Russula brevipes]